MELCIKAFLLIVFINVICLPKFIIGSTCPLATELPKRTEESEDKSMCAIVYKDKNCGGDSDMIYNGETNMDMPFGWNDRITSLVVRPGCIYTGYQHDGCDDSHDHKEFQGVHPDLNDEHIHVSDWSNAISSFKCSCIYNPIDCKPTDEWNQLFYCSNSMGGDDAIKCKYHQSHGYTVGNQISSGHEITGEIAGEVMGELDLLFIKFEGEGNPSLSTGYSWSTSHEFSQSFEEGEEVIFPVEPGHSAAVYQVQGSCGDTTIGAQCYDVRDVTTNKQIRNDCPNPPTGY